MRISTSKQGVERRELIMDKLGVKYDKEYIDKVSGKYADRPKLKQMLKELESGDVVYCESISRLGRNVDDLRALCRSLTDRGITVYFVKEGFNIGGSTYEFLLTILGKCSRYGTRVDTRKSYSTSLTNYRDKAKDGRYSY